jgi:hypothetical protein
MNKLITFVAVMVVAALVPLSVMEDYSSQPPLIGAEVTSFDRKTTELLIKYRCFKDTLESAVQALTQGEISLPEATARVHSAAECFCPIYLNRIRFAEKGATSKERIARNLVGHVRSRAEGDPSLTRRGQALRIELECLVSEFNGKIE